MDIFVNPSLLMHARREFFFYYFRLKATSFVKNTRLLPGIEIFEEDLLNLDNIQQDYIHE